MVLKLVVPIIAVIGAGFLAVAFYRRNNPGVAVKAGSGARLGALCGFFCFGMTTILGSLRVAILQQGPEIRRELLEAIQQSASRYSDPQFQATLDLMRSPVGIVFIITLLLILGLAMFLLLGTVGGLLAGAAQTRRDRPYLG